MRSGSWKESAVKLAMPSSSARRFWKALICGLMPPEPCTKITAGAFPFVSGARMLVPSYVLSPVTDAGSTVQDCAMASAIVRSVCTQAFPLIVPCGTSADMAGAASAMRSAAASAEILVFMVSLSLMNVRAHRDSGRFTRRAAGALCQE